MSREQHDPLQISGIPGSEPLSGIPGVESTLASSGLPGADTIPPPSQSRKPTPPSEIVRVLPEIPGADSVRAHRLDTAERPRDHVWLWIELAIAVVLQLSLGLLTLGFVINATAAHEHAGVSRTGQAVSAGVCAGLVYLVTRWLVRVEHRLRGEQPAAQAYARADIATAGGAMRVASAARSAPAGAPRSRSAPRRRRRHYGPVAVGCSTALFGAVAAGMIVAAISEHSQGDRSAFVQAHGTPAGGVVESVDNTQECSKSSCDYTAAVSIDLTGTVDGVRSTVAHYDDYSDLVDGDAVDVLVDPQQPAYAEFPGSKFVSSWQWLVFALLSVPFGVLTVYEARELRRLLAHRREHGSASSSIAAGVA